MNDTMRRVGICAFMTIFFCSCAAKGDIKASLEKKYSPYESEYVISYWGSIDGDRGVGSEDDLEECLNIQEEGVSTYWMMERRLLDCMKGKGWYFIKEEVLVTEQKEVYDGAQERAQKRRIPDAENCAVACPYSEKIKQHIDVPHNSRVVEQLFGVDSGSHELTRTHVVEFANGDLATVEQKYCSMYNFYVIYKISSLSETSIEGSLQNIHRLIDGVEQDYHLKAPLENIVDMSMNQRKLSLQDSFSFSLPGQAATSHHYVEHSFSFKRLPDQKTAQAEIHFYFALGGG